MQSSDIFVKTPKGQSEIGSKTDALSMKERRVLILVNGVNDLATLERLSLCDNITAVLERLLRLNFIASVNAAAPVEPVRPDSFDDDDTVRDISARELMCNSLLTFGNRVRVGKLIDAIDATDDFESLDRLIQPWYEALADTPGGKYQADSLRKEVLKLIEFEATSVD